MTGRLLVSVVTALGCVACSSKTYLMPTPTVYAVPGWNAFENVPSALQGDSLSVLYVTDRVPESETPDAWRYGTGRSRSTAFGEAMVQFGDGLSWERLVEISRSARRDSDVELRITATRELARFGQTPPRLVLTDAQMAAHGQQEAQAAQSANAEAERHFRAEISARLAKTPRKEVFVYIHGFGNTFEEAILTTAEISHFLGREGVAICYTWPVGIGFLKAYEYTVASTEFTIYHLKQALRLIASCPDVEKVHLVAHSRGTAVVSDAVRELHIELRSTADTQKVLKLGSVVLAAADIDLDTAIARNATERIGLAVERTAVYISHEDKALGLSSWLFGGVSRLGDVDPKIFDKSEIDALRSSKRLQLIDARVKQLGAFGHSYFRANPAVSSDVVLFLRYGLPPGAAHGRPLAITDGGLWAVEDDYPGSEWSPAFLTGTN